MPSDTTGAFLELVHHLKRILDALLHEGLLPASLLVERPDGRRQGGRQALHLGGLENGEAAPATVLALGAVVFLGLAERAEGCRVKKGTPDVMPVLPVQKNDTW